RQVHSAAAVGSVNMPNFASPTRRDLSCSGTFSASPLVFVNIGTLACSSSLPIHRRIEGVGFQELALQSVQRTISSWNPCRFLICIARLLKKTDQLGKPALGAAGAGCRLTRPFYRTGCLLIHVVGSIHSGQA